LLLDVRYAPMAGQIPRRSETTLSAMSRLMHRNQLAFYSITSSALASTAR
jgi:hypothetical protein